MAGHMIRLYGPEQLATVGLERAFVVFMPGGEAIPVVQIGYRPDEPIIQGLLDGLPEGAKVYPDYACLINDIPLRSH